MSTQLPTLSVVVPAYNEAATIIDCLSAFLTQTVAAEEIIVVDNNSADDTVALVRAFAKAHPALSVRLVREKKQGMIPARNAGVDSAKSDIIARIDADTRVTRTWVEVAKRAFVPKTVSALSGPVSYYDMPFEHFGRHADDGLRRFVQWFVPNYPMLFGSNMAIRRTAWQQIRDVVAEDPTDVMHEDVDIGLCLRAAQLTIRYDPKLIARISARRLESSPREYEHYMRRFRETYRHHCIRGLRYGMPPTIFRIIYFPLKGVRALYKLTARSHA